MPVWLEAIAEEIDGIGEMDVQEAEPCDDAGPREHIAGTIPLELRRVWALQVRYNRLLNALVDRMEVSSRGERETMRGEYRRLYSQAYLLERIFWMACRHEFPELWEKPRVGIRKGWQMVWSDVLCECELRFVGVGAEDLFDTSIHYDADGTRFDPH